MSRTIADLTAGTIIYLDETVDGTLSHVPFIYLGQDDSGNCRILRQYAAVAQKMNSTNEATYDGCLADTWLNNETDGYLSRFDGATRLSFVATQIKINSISTSTVGTIARRCFLLSESEVGNTTTPDEGTSILDVLKTVANTTNANTARIAYNESLSAVNWWLRSAASEAQFRYVISNGFVVSSNAASTFWLRPALSVAPATIVSDQGEDTIYLLPDSSKLYREIDATIYCGSSTARPKKARAIVPATNCSLFELQISNNAKDDSPIWVSAENNVAVDLSNDTKTTTDWELGVKIYAQSSGKALIGEPVVIVETESE